jgi:predicted nucleic acid-binding protein
MMRVLLDTDVVLDVVLAREPFVAASAAVWVAHEQQRIDALVSAITPVNTFYIVRRLRSVVVAREADSQGCCNVARPARKRAGYAYEGR